MPPSDRRTPRRCRPGFSLLEITLVLVIIGLLIGGAAVAFGPALGRAKVRTTKASMTTIKQQILAYQGENSALPVSLDQLVPGYLEAGKVKDGWNQEFYYRANAPGATPAFELVSSGEDLEFETADDLDIWALEQEESN